MLAGLGAQDQYLYSSPQVTILRAMYRRIAPVTFETIEQIALGTADFGKRVAWEIARQGDFLHRLTLEIDLPELTSPDGSNIKWCDFPGHRLVSEASVEVGGQEMDKWYWHTFQQFADLTLPSEAHVRYNESIGHEYAVHHRTGDSLGDARLQAWTTNTKPAKTLYIPLQFWFCRYIGLALPLIALQYHQVRIYVTFARASELIITDGALPDVHLGDVTLLAEYAFCDTPERRKVAQVGHEYLIETVQFNGNETVTSADHKIRLSQINHPIKFFLIAYAHCALWEEPSESNDYRGYQWFNWTDSVAENDEFSYDPAGAQGPLTICKLVLNGIDAQQLRQGSYYNLVEPLNKAQRGLESKGLYIYSFAHSPLQYQVTSTCNLSRIDHAAFQNRIAFSDDFTSVCATALVTGFGFNVFRVMSGLGGKAFSN